MIRTLVVDDDYHVAHAHALSVARVPGFSATGEAHSAEEARLLIRDEPPDLLLLDMYLPDYSGLDLIRRLTSESTGSTEPDAPGHVGHVPDFLLVTAARDIQSVRSAMQLGAIYTWSSRSRSRRCANSSSPTGSGGSAWNDHPRQIRAQ